MKIVIFLVILWMPCVFAIEIKSRPQKDQVEILVSNIPIPVEEFKKQSRSGLTTTILSQVANVVDGQVWKHTLDVYFDLWDEHYVIKIHEGQKTETLTKKTADEVLSLVQNQKFIVPETLKSDLKIVYQATLNPISKEKEKKVRKWLAENNVNLPSSSQREGGPKSATDTKPNHTNPGASLTTGLRLSGLVTRVLDSKLNEDGVGAWTYRSEVFELKSEVQR